MGAWFGDRDLASFSFSTERRWYRTSETKQEFPWENFGSISTARPLLTFAETGHGKEEPAPVCQHLLPASGSIQLNNPAAEHRPSEQHANRDQHAQSRT